MYWWMVGAYPESRADKVHALVGLNDVGVIMQNQRVRWAASVYARHLPELWEIAKPILRGVLGDEVKLRWIEGVRNNKCEVQVDN